MPNPSSDRAIAIVGVGAILPDALNAPAFWQNIVNKRYCISETPADRWSIADYYDPDPAAPDKSPMVYVDGAFHCDTRPLDRVANAHGRRRTLPAAPVPDFEPTGLRPLEQLAREHYELPHPAGVQPFGTEEDPT